MSEQTRRAVIRIAVGAALAAGSACAGASANGEGDPSAAGAPVVIGTTPANGDMAVDPSTSRVTATFDRAMETSGWSWVIEMGHPPPNVNGIPFYADDTTAVLPVQLEPGTTYVLWINSPDDAQLRNFASLEGISARAHRVRFRTR